MSASFYSSRRQSNMLHAWRDLVRQRGLLRDLVSKDLRARYRNAMMGFLWAIIQPLLMTLILVFVFNALFKSRVGEEAAAGINAPFVLSGLILWQFLSQSLLTMTRSLLDNENLVKKVYFPREAIPIAAMANCFINFAIGFLVLLAFHLAMGGGVSLSWLWLPVIFGLVLALTLGLGLLLSCANAFFRDVSYFVEVALMFGFYATPIFYPAELIQSNAPAWAFRLYTLNPMVQGVTAFRQALLGGRLNDPGLLLWPAAVAALSLAAGAAVFRWKAPVLADHL